MSPQHLLPDAPNPLVRRSGRGVSSNSSLLSCLRSSPHQITNAWFLLLPNYRETSRAWRPPATRLKEVPQIHWCTFEAALLSTTPRTADDVAIKQQNAPTDHKTARAFLAKGGGNPAKSLLEGRSNIVANLVVLVLKVHTI